MTLTGMKKHVGVLEQAGLVATEKVGRVRTCRLGPRRLAEETAWIEDYRQLWASRFDALDRVVEELKQKEKIDGRKGEGDPAAAKNRTTVERTSERELVVTRTFNAPARLVFEAWTRPELLKRWWAPKSFGAVLHFLRGRRPRGGRLPFRVRPPASEQPMAFFGRYIEVTPHSRLVWTNEEGGEDGAVTTVTFEERGGETLVVMHDLYPSREALDSAIASGGTSGFSETFEQLDELLAASAAH